MIVVSGQEQQGAVNVELPNPVVVKVTDEDGNAIPGQIVNFRIVDGGGSVFAGAAVTNANGLAQERWTLGKTAGETQTLQARAVDPETGAALVFATFTATAVAGPPTSIEKTAGDNTQATVGTAVADPPSVRLVDAFGNLVVGATVSFAVVSGGGSVTGASPTTDASGVARVGSWTLGSTAGTNTLSATASGLPGSPVLFTATAAGTLTAVTLGGWHTCAQTAALKSYCWGGNPNGQLGNGSFTGYSPNPTPTPVSGTVTFASLAGGSQHTCGLTASGAAYCWGSNELGQLGDGTTVSRSTPVPVSGSLSFRLLAAGGSHTCGLTTTDAAYCWGLNGYGTLGTGDFVNRLAPTPVAGGLSFQSLVSGVFHVCGLTIAGSAYCWGQNMYGELGDNSTTARPTPVPVVNGPVFQSLSAGDRLTCGLTSSGAAYCWGANNPYGGVGDGTIGFPRNTPTAVVGGLTFKQIAVGGSSVCALTLNGAGYCWGFNMYGQNADGAPISYPNPSHKTSPTAIVENLSFDTISGGGWHFCGRTAQGAVYCWGWNGVGQLGDGTAGDGSSSAANSSSTPRLVRAP